MAASVGGVFRHETSFRVVGSVSGYRRLFESVTEETIRHKILNLFAEEQQKKKEATDPI
jgi:hypothetical protein